MTTRTRTGRRSPGRLDPRALPIALKLAIGLGVALLISGIVTNQLVQNVVEDTQIDLVESDLQSLSRIEAFRTVDVLGQEMVALNRLGADEAIQEQLLEPPTFPSEESETFVPAGIISRRLAEFRVGSEEFDAIAVLDSEGHVLASNPMISPSDLPEPGGWGWYQEALADGEGSTFLSESFNDNLTGQSGVHIALPIYQAGNPDRLLGVIYGVWNMTNLPEIAQVRDRELFVAEPDGTILFSQEGTLPGDQFPSWLMDRIGQQPQAGDFSLPDSNDVPWLYGYTSFSDLGLQDEMMRDLGWIVVMREPLAVTTSDIASLTNQLRVAIGISSVLVMVIIGGLAVVFLRPLRRLTDAANQILAGQLDTPIPELPRDELGTLANVLRDLVEQLLYRVQQLNAAVEVSRVAMSTIDVNEMLEGIAQEMTQDLGYAGVAVYLADASGREARLATSAGEAIDLLNELSDTIAVDETTMLGRAMLLNEPQLRGGTRLFEVYSADRRATHPEIAIALQVGGRTIGGMQVSTSRDRVLEQEDIDVLNLVGDQVSAAIQNARLFEQSAANIAEIEALNRRLTRQAWEEYLEEDEALRHTLDPDNHWPDPLEELRGRTEVSAEIFTDEDGRTVLAAPLVLRGETIGTLAVTRPSGALWTRDETLLMEAIASRLGMIAEGIRLVEESSLRAAREQRVNEVSANLLQRAASVDSVLQSALGQLSGALGSDHVSLRLGRPPMDDNRQIGSGSGPDGDGQQDGRSPQPSDNQGE